MKKIKVNEIENFRIGNAQDLEGATGCTVIVCEKGATAGVDVRGGVRRHGKLICSVLKIWSSRSMLSLYRAAPLSVWRHQVVSWSI